MLIDKEIVNDGLNIGGIEHVMTDILSYTNRANQILNNISSIIDDTKTCFKCEAGDSFREQYASVSIDISTLNNNFLSYNLDFGRVVNNYRHRDDVSAEIVTANSNYSSGKREENL